MREVDIGLDEESIAGLMKGWKAYTRTEYLILKNVNDYAILELHKTQSPGLFKDLSDYSIVALPDQIVYHEDPGLDVLNTPALARVQALYPGKTVIVSGMFSHVNFIKDLVPVRFMVVDNVPPSPSKLGVLVDIALGSGYIDLPLVKEERIIDMADMVSSVKTEGVMFPCRVSNLKADKPFQFLDDVPEVKNEVTLIGCHLSCRIFKDLYGYEPPFINVCPADFVDPDVKTIVKCCKVKQGHVIEGNTVKVPWGATVPEVVDAINALFSGHEED